MPSARSASSPAPRLASAARAGTRKTVALSTAAADADPSAKRPARRSQAERREEAERRLLDAALHIVAKRGAVRMTLAEVGEAAGYSRGLPAARFGSKAGLVQALADHIGQRFGAQRALTGESPAPGLDAILGNIAFYFGRNRGRASGDWAASRALLVMMSESCMEPADELRRIVAAYNRDALAWFEHHIRVGIANGEIAPDTPPDTTAVLLLGAMRGALQQWLVEGPRRIQLDAVRDRLLAMTRQVLGAMPSAQPAPPNPPAPTPAAAATPTTPRSKETTP